MNASEEDDHWLRQLRGFSQRVVNEIHSTRAQLQGITLDLHESRPLEEQSKSLWVDGGSAFFDMVGGSIYIVRAAAGIFQPNESVEWHERMDVGFTTLPRNVDRFVGLRRDILEIECMLELLHDDIDFAVLDNGLTSYASMGVPHSTLQYFSAPVPDDSPDFEYFQTFTTFMRRYDVLIQQCLILDTPLVGAVKDPRSRSYSRQLVGIRSLNDSSAISMLARGRIGFTSSLDAGYLDVPRVRQYLEANSILTDGRGEFMRVFGILKANGNVFRLDFLKGQQAHIDRVKQFAVSMHDGNGYLLPSHVVHNRATLPDVLSDSLANLVVSSIAKEDMEAARFIFGEQRRSRFG